MSSNIEWCEETWNPVAGCSKVSEGCRNCYAIRDAYRLAGNPNPKIKSVYAGLTERVNGRTNWTGTVRFIPERLHEPLRRKKPTRYFVNSMSDLFHEEIRKDEIDSVFAAMALATQHQFLVLTKRPKRMLDWSEVAHEAVSELIRYPDFLPANGRTYPRSCDWPLPNVQLGVSVEDRKTA